MSSKDKRKIIQLQQKLNELNKRVPSLEEMNNKIEELNQKEKELKTILSVVNVIPSEKIDFFYSFLKERKHEKGIARVASLYMNMFRA